MNKYYVVRNGFDFKVIFMDQATADLWVKVGWEIGAHPYESQYEALVAMERWKADKRTPP